jgi:hypothetical protein
MESRSERFVHAHQNLRPLARKVKHPISWNAVLAVMPDPYRAHLRLYRRRSNY